MTTQEEKLDKHEDKIQQLEVDFAGFKKEIRFLADVVDRFRISTDKLIDRVDKNNDFVIGIKSTYESQQKQINDNKDEIEKIGKKAESAIIKIMYISGIGVGLTTALTVYNILN